MTAIIPPPYQGSVLEKVNDVGLVSGATTVPEPTTKGTLIRMTAQGDTALTMPAAVAGKTFTLALRQDATGGHAWTFATAVSWANNAAPQLTTQGLRTDVLSFFCVAPASGWVGLVAGTAFPN